VINKIACFAVTLFLAGMLACVNVETGDVTQESNQNSRLDQIVEVKQELDEDDDLVIGIGEDPTGVGDPNRRKEPCNTPDCLDPPVVTIVDPPDVTIVDPPVVTIVDPPVIVPNNLLCLDTCPYAFDGECDDGGPGSLYSVCGFGTDCGDCGPRDNDVIVTDGICSDTCPYAVDGECDDGGPGSLYSVCGFGTDCGDCGPRDDDIVIGPTGLCTDTCFYAFDGECDDGGPGSLYSVCGFGSDCGDCGPR
jgi:bacterioferritin-associated ferredoxin